MNRIDSVIERFDKFLESKTGCFIGWIWFAALILTLAMELAIIV